MTGSGIEKRDSRALEPELISDPRAKAEAEARNGLRQYDAGIAAIQTALERGSFKLRTSLILGLHREALNGISMFAGNSRPAGVKIQGSKHEPVGAHMVPELVEDMCDYVNDLWLTATPLHLGAYVMWRLNWIHPFAGTVEPPASPRMWFFRFGPVPCFPARRPFPIRLSTTAGPTLGRWTQPTRLGAAAMSTSRVWRSCSGTCWLGSSRISTKQRAASFPRK